MIIPMYLSEQRYFDNIFKINWIQRESQILFILSVNNLFRTNEMIFELISHLKVFSQSKWTSKSIFLFENNSFLKIQIIVCDPKNDAIASGFKRLPLLDGLYVVKSSFPISTDHQKKKSAVLDF